MSRGTSFLSVVGCALAAATFLLVVSPAEVANADECVKHCRAQHNACRMRAKLLSSAACDAQLQSCISRCVRR